MKEKTKFTIIFSLIFVCLTFSSTAGGQVWVNLGAGSGVNVGDEFEVIRMGEELIDPDTGLSLGAVEEKVGTIVITQVTAKYAIARIQSGSAQAKDYLKKI